MKLFKAKLAEKYGTGGERIIFSDDALWGSADYSVVQIFLC